MDFSRLPDPVFLQILEYLPLEEIVRAGHVNKIFRRIAQLAVSHTKSLDLNERRFRNLNGYQFSVILDLCAQSLKRIKFLSRDGLWHSGLSFDEHRQRYATLEDIALQLALMFCNYECPRLTEINLGFTSIDFSHFERLIRNNPKLESLLWHVNFIGFPKVTSNSLKKLDLVIDNNTSLQTLIGRCPNLQEIDLNMENNAIMANILDEFFISAPQLHRVSLHNDTRQGGNLIRLESELINFWNLSLTSLRLSFLCYDYPDDNLLYKVARSFPHLQKISFHSLTEPTDTGIACLGDLQELKEIELHLVTSGQSRYDQGIRQFISCKKLRQFSMISSYISGGSLVQLLRSCPQLKHINIWDTNDADSSKVDSSEDVAAILESLAGISKSDITICICSYGSLWGAENVKAAIRMLEENHGLKIKILVR